MHRKEKLAGELPNYDILYDRPETTVGPEALLHSMPGPHR